MHVRHAFLALSLATVIAPSGNAQSVQRLTVSANHRFLQRADGSPFFWLGDTGWLLFSRLDRAATLRYLDDRRAKGFNVIQVMVYSYTGRPFELRLGTISGASVRAWWYSPRDGSARSIGIFLTGGPGGSHRRVGLRKATTGCSCWTTCPGDTRDRAFPGRAWKGFERRTLSGRLQAFQSRRRTRTQRQMSKAVVNTAMTTATAIDHLRTESTSPERCCASRPG